MPVPTVHIYSGPTHLPTPIIASGEPHLKMADANSSSASDIEKSGGVEEIKQAHHEHVEVGEKFSALRIDGDDEDHMHEPPMTFKRAMSLLAMAFLWTGSQIPVYLYGKTTTSIDDPRTDCPLGAIPPYIYGDIGGVDRWIWFVSDFWPHFWSILTLD